MLRRFMNSSDGLGAWRPPPRPGNIARRLSPAERRGKRSGLHRPKVQAAGPAAIHQSQLPIRQP